MKSFTSTEIGWIANHLEARADDFKTERDKLEVVGGSLYTLYTMQIEAMQSMAERLRQVVADGDKRIEIK